jgi:YD repeat-containing protein
VNCERGAGGGGLACKYITAGGNLTFDGIWTYTWDTENRLIEMTLTNTVSGIAASNRLKLDFAYDYMSQRISKIVSTNSTVNSFVAQSTNYFIYDGWSLIATFTPKTNVLQVLLVGGLRMFLAKFKDLTIHLGGREFLRQKF